MVQNLTSNTRRPWETTTRTSTSAFVFPVSWPIERLRPELAAGRKRKLQRLEKQASTWANFSSEGRLEEMDASTLQASEPVPRELALLDGEQHLADLDKLSAPNTA